MKISKKIAATAIGLAFMGSAAYAQSLDDAKTAINAEQYQKAKSMLTNLTVTQSTKDENYFYLGWVYLKQDEPDSAKLWFNKGLAVNPKSSLNYVGLGAVARLNKDQAGALSNFNTALANAAKKDSKPYVFIGKSYLLTAVPGAPVAAADAQAAVDVLTKGAAVNPKDDELLIARGDAEASQLKNNDAYTDYAAALDVNPKSAAASVAQGVLLKFANNYDDARTDFQNALKIDPNFGPAYREWAETDLREAKGDPKVAADKYKSAADEYKKYITLTDYSLQSQMRYADFLISDADYTTLQTVATQLSKSAGTNLRVYRYLGYAAYENKDYANGLTAMNTWMTKADPNRIIPRDYLYLGRLQVAAGQDSIGVITLQKAYTLDTTQYDVLEEIAKAEYTKKKYKAAGDEYYLFVSKGKGASLTDLFNEGRSYFFAYQEQFFSKATPKPVADTTLLIRADTAFSKVQQKALHPVADVALFRARTNDYREPDRNTTLGLAKPFYENYIDLVLAKGIPQDDRSKSGLAEAYDYLGRYYELKAKDDVKASDNYTKALTYVPTDAQALDYQKRKGKK